MNNMIPKLIGVVAIAAIAACGGGSGSSSNSTLSGTAAVGAAIASGKITVSCAGGSAQTTTSDSVGGWQVSITGQTLPCAVQVSGGTVNGTANATSYYSIAVAPGTVNITPLTNLILTNMVGASLDTWFSGLSSATLAKLSASGLDSATLSVLTATSIKSAMGTGNPFTTPFKPVAGNLQDDILEALAKAGSYAALLAAAQSGGTLVKPQGFDFDTAFKNTSSGGSSTGTGSNGGTCSGTNLLFTGNSTTGFVKSGDTVCFTIATTSHLDFTLPTGPVTLSNPTLDSGGFTFFTDTSMSLGYEVIFDSSNKVQEINVINTAVPSNASNSFVGQFAPDPAVACPAKGGTAIPNGQAFGGACKMPQTTQVACTTAGFNFEPIGSICWTNP